MKKVHDECQADPKTKVSDDYMRKAAAGEKDASESNAKRHELCMSQKLGLMDEHGKVVKAEIRNSLSHVIHDEAKLDEVVNKCSIDKDTPEDTGFDLWVCMFKETKPLIGRRPSPSGDHGLHHN